MNLLSWPDKTVGGISPKSNTPAASMEGRAVRSWRAETMKKNAEDASGACDV